MDHDGFFYAGGGEDALARDAHTQANTAASDARKARSAYEELNRRFEIRRR